MSEDSTPQTPPEILLQIQQAVPRWMQDGFGVRGNPISSEMSASSSPSWRSAAPPSGEAQQFDFGTSGSASNTPSQNSVNSVAAPTVVPAPFKVYTRVTSAGVTQAGVEYNSQLSNSYKPGDSISIKGLLNETQTTGWITVSDGDLVYLELTLNPSGGVMTNGANIMFGNLFTNGAWTLNGYVEDNGGTPPVQDTARIALAEISVTAATKDTPPVVSANQLVFTHLMMRSVAIAGRAAKYPLPA